MFEANENGEYFSELAEHPVWVAYNGSGGFIVDLIECFLGSHGVATPPARTIQKCWDNIFDQNPNAYILHLCHSQGGFNTKLVDANYPEDRRKRICIIPIASPEYFDPDRFADVTHYRATLSRDFIANYNIAGMIRAGNTITTLPSHPDAPFHDHGARSPTFKNAIRDRFTEFFKEYGEK